MAEPHPPELTTSEKAAHVESTGAFAGSGQYGRMNWIGLFSGLGLFVLMLLLPAPEGLAPAGWRTAAIAILMAVWWMTEALPIPATALVPLVLLPIFNIGSIAENATPYAHPLIWLFLGGFMIALAMQRWNLHRRIALNIINRIGTRPVAIIIGFAVSSAFLSMWISNTAATLMLLPVALSVIDLVPVEATSKIGRNFAIGILLCLAYAANLGGLGTLIGTPTNGLLVAYLQDQYGIDISFAEWLLIGFPFVLVSVPLMVVLMTRFVYPVRAKTIPGGEALIRQGLIDLGRIKKPEVMVAIVFAGTAVLWMFRPLIARAVPGISDASIAIFGALVLFALPVDARRGVFVLNWEWARRLPWGVLILFGGGLSLAGAISRTGLSAWIGGQMSAISTWPLVFLIAVAVMLIIFLTELTSNSATAAAFLPILASVAIGVLSENPLLFLIPATFAASCAFMLPVATPPNAIVYGSGHITIREMARSGLFLNLMFIVVITAATYLLFGPVMGVELGTVPSWAQP